MEEARRFIRYVVPGLTFFIEFLIYVLIYVCISGDWFIWRLIAQTTKSASLTGVAVSGFLVLSGLGFLFGVIYYVIVWCEYLGLGADLRPFLGKAEGWLNLRYCNKKIETTKLSKRGAWRVVTSYLNMRVGSSVQIKGAWEGGLERLSDLMNSLGTTLVACVGSLVGFGIFVLLRIFGWFGERSEVSVLGLVIVAIVWFLVLVVHRKNYKGVIEDYENICGSILLNEFEYQHYNGPPITLYVFQNDLKNECLKGKEG